MITISTSGSAVVFEFDDNQHYLQSGTIEVPINSLTLVTDDSEMFTFRKAATNDIFVSGLYSEIGMTKDELIAYYKANMVGSTGGGSGSGMTSGEVQTMIDDSISGKADTSAVTEAISAAVSGKLDTSTFETYSGSVETALSGKQDTLIAGSGITIDSANTISCTVEGGGKAIAAGRGISVTTGSTADTVSLNLPVYSGGESSIIMSTTGSGGGNSAVSYGGFVGGFDNAISGNNSMAYGTSLVTHNIAEAAFGNRNISRGQTNTFNSDPDVTLFTVGNGTSPSNRHNAFEIRQNGDIYITSGGSDIKLQDNLGGGGGVSSATVQTMIDESISGKQDTLSAGTGISIDSANTISVTASSNNVIEVTQAEYDALVSAGTVDLTALYVITDAPEIDINNYYTSAQTNSAITAAVSGKLDTSTFETYSGSVETALSGKQDTLIAGSGISIDSTNTISVTGGSGGGKAIEAGTNISVTTGETADTINCTLPISVGVTNSLAFGDNTNTAGGNSCISIGGRYCSAQGNNTFAQGYYTTAKSYYSHSEGCYTTANTEASHTEGKYTYTSNECEHTQGQYNVSSSASTTFGDSGNTLFSVGNGTADNARHNALEIRQNGDIYCNNGASDVKLQDYLQVKVVQISQSDYDQLQNKDANTLYLITNS